MRAAVARRVANTPVTFRNSSAAGCGHNERARPARGQHAQPTPRPGQRACHLAACRRRRQQTRCPVLQVSHPCEKAVLEAKRNPWSKGNRAPRTQRPGGHRRDRVLVPALPTRYPPRQPAGASNRSTETTPTDPRRHYAFAQTSGSSVRAGTAREGVTIAGRSGQQSCCAGTRWSSRVAGRAGLHQSGTNSRPRMFPRSAGGSPALSTIDNARDRHPLRNSLKQHSNRRPGWRWRLRSPRRRSTRLSGPGQGDLYDRHQANLSAELPGRVALRPALWPRRGPTDRTGSVRHVGLGFDQCARDHSSTSSALNLSGSCRWGDSRWLSDGNVAAETSGTTSRSLALTSAKRG